MWYITMYGKQFQYSSLVKVKAVKEFYEACALLVKGISPH